VRYPELPPVGALSAPELKWDPTGNKSSRGGELVHWLFIHVWGGGTFGGVIDWQKHSSGNEAVSSHVVYAGEIGPDAGKAAQLVAWSEKAWTECMMNPRAVSIESADAIWQGHDPHGFARLARMAALIMAKEGLPMRWVRGDAFFNGGRGITRHADAGTLGCGHGFCPTTDMALWGQFLERVTLERRHGGFRKGKYGRSE
jgi:N-acetylmuramoyl-L-alanine amidase